MKFARSLQARLALTIGGGVAMLWVAASLITANLVSHEIDEVFDSSLEETAQRILPLAIQEIFDRDEDGTEQLINPLRTKEEFLTYVVRNAEGRVLLRSHDAKIANFPAFKQNGFIQTATHRLYYDSALDCFIAIRTDYRTISKGNVFSRVFTGCFSLFTLCHYRHYYGKSMENRNTNATF